MSNSLPGFAIPLGIGVTIHVAFDVEYRRGYAWATDRISGDAVHIARWLEFTDSYMRTWFMAQRHRSVFCTGGPAEMYECYTIDPESGWSESGWEDAMGSSVRSLATTRHHLPDFVRDGDRRAA